MAFERQFFVVRKLRENYLPFGRFEKGVYMNVRTVCLISTVVALAAVSGVFAQKKIIVPKDFKSIQKAIDEAGERDTVFVQNGVYKESIVLKDYVAVIGQETEKTVIQGNGSKAVVEGANYSVLKNFTIENGGTGIICKNTNPVIEHNIVRNNKKTGIHCLISLPEIKNNLIYSNKWSGIYCELITNAQRTSIDHNLIADNGYSGIMLANRSEVLIQDNIFFTNRQYGIYVNEDSKRSRIVYNDFYNNRVPFNMYAVINETNISIDPILSPGEYTFFNGKSQLKGMGKEGCDIGPMGEAALEKNDKKSAEAIQAINKDSDGDGIPDIYDKCPQAPEDFDGFQDQDGCPDYDNDGDGIPDSLDKCPNTPEDFNGYMDDDGCPDGGKPPINQTIPGKKPDAAASAASMQTAPAVPAQTPAQQKPAPAQKDEQKPVKK